MKLSTTQDPTRRNVVKSTAWAAPVIAAAVAAPAASASTVPTDYTLSVEAISVAPSIGTVIDGQPVLRPDQRFNTFIGFLNAGPADAPSVSGQVTFDQGSIPGESVGEFSVNSPWIITSIGTNDGLSRWVVNVTYSGVVAAGAMAPQLIVSARTRLAPAHPMGDSGPYTVLARVMGAGGASADTQNDYYYVRR